MLEKYSFSSERACGFSTASLERAWSPVPTLSGVLPQWNCSHANPWAHGLRTWPSPWHMATIFFHEHMHVCVFLHVTCRRLISVKRIRILTKQESIMKQNNNTTKKIQTKQNKWLLSKWIWHQKSSLMLRLLQKAQAPARWGFKQQTKQYSTVFMREQHDRLYLGFIPKA